MLNPDCILHILSHLPVHQRQHTRCVCSSWKQTADHLNRAQKKLMIVSKYYQSNEVRQEVDPAGEFSGKTCQNQSPTHLIVWPTSYMRYSLFTSVLETFCNLTEISFIDIDQWCDPMVATLVELCPKLTKLEMISCSGFGGNRWNDFFFNNVTERGWQELSAFLGSQLEHLTLRDCDLDSSHLEVIFNSFPKLKHLDVSHNSSIKSFGTSLANLNPALRCLKIGPDLNKDDILTESPLQGLAEAKIELKELYLNSVLSASTGLSLLAKPNFASLEVFVLKYFKPLLETDHPGDGDYFEGISHLKELKRLELHQLHTHDGVNAITFKQLAKIFKNCTQLTKLAITSDCWCESSFSDLNLKIMIDNLKNLTSLTLSPGGFYVTDKSLELLAKLDHLINLELVSFPLITDKGMEAFLDAFNLNKSFKPFNLHLKDCDKITDNCIPKIIDYAAGNPRQKLCFNFSETSMSQTVRLVKIRIKNYPPIDQVIIKSGKFNLPPNLILNIGASVDGKPPGIGDEADGHSIGCKAIFSLFKAFASIITSFSTTMTVGVTIGAYLIHHLIQEHLSALPFLLFSTVATLTVVPIGVIIIGLSNSIMNGLPSVFFYGGYAGGHHFMIHAAHNNNNNNIINYNVLEQLVDQVNHDNVGQNTNSILHEKIKLLKQFIEWIMSKIPF